MAEPEIGRCCTKCHDTRTSEDFLRNHFKPINVDQSSQGTQNCQATQSVASDDNEYAVCRQPYGSENTAVMMRDDAYQVVGLAGCQHTLGIACVKQVVRAHDNGLLRCPLCRAEWCYVICDDAVGEATDPLNLRDYYTKRQMLLYGTDYATMCVYLYGRSDAGYVDGTNDRHPTWFLQWDYSWRAVLQGTLDFPEFEVRLYELSQRCAATLQNPGSDPWTVEALLSITSDNALTFTNWNADSRTILQACFYASRRCPRGLRICDGYFDFCKAGWHCRVDRDGLKGRAFEIAKDDWRVVRDEDDNEEFVDFLLDLTWVICAHLIECPGCEHCEAAKAGEADATWVEDGTAVADIRSADAEEHDEAAECGNVQNANEVSIV